MRSAWLVLLLVGACRSSGLATGNDDLAGADLAGRDLASTGVHDLSIAVAKDHRVDDSQCSMARGSGSCSFGGGGGMQCVSDNDCSAGTNGRCSQAIGGPAFCYCTYDTCQHDTDCPTGQLCACHDSVYNYDGNHCTNGNCRVDADCNGRACSPSLAPMGCGSLGGYYCHVAADECTNDADCQNSTNGPQVCTFDNGAGHWKCTPELFCQ